MNRNGVEEKAALLQFSNTQRQDIGLSEVQMTFGRYSPSLLASNINRKRHYDETARNLNLSRIEPGNKGTIQRE